MTLSPSQLLSWLLSGFTVSANCAVCNIINLLRRLFAHFTADEIFNSGGNRLFARMLPAQQTSRYQFAEIDVDGYGGDVVAFAPAVTTRTLG
jgi:hypothetical protein